MAREPKVEINQRNLMVEMRAADPVLKKVAEQVMREAFFDPAVEAMQEEFASHKVTNEIAGGLGAPNITGTLEGDFREEEGDVTASLWGFIGFDAKKQTPEQVLEPIFKRLDPNHRDGPKLVYAGRENDKIVYHWEVRAPNETAIWDATPLPWLEEGGPSWVKRIEQGIPGVGHFLNVANRPSSRSGGGIQIEGTLRSGRYRPTPYLTSIINNFLRRAGGRKATGKSSGRGPLR